MNLDERLRESGWEPDDWARMREFYDRWSAARWEAIEGSESLAVEDLDERLTILTQVATATMKLAELRARCAPHDYMHMGGADDGRQILACRRCGRIRHEWSAD